VPKHPLWRRVGAEGTFRSSMISSLDTLSYQRFAPPTGVMRRDGFYSEPQLPPLDGEVTSLTIALHSSPHAGGSYVTPRRRRGLYKVSAGL
jgi:hypothetical protein